MMTVLGCIVQEHDLWMVLMAGLICGFGSWAMVRLFLRAAASDGLERHAWVVLAAFVSGAAIWCTHFVAMLGYEPGVATDFDPVLTIVSLLIAMAGSGVGFLIATARLKAAPALGGAVVGLSVVVMHYTGMLAYRVQGIVSWDQGYLVTSIVLSCLLAAASLHVALRTHRRALALPMSALLFFAAILSLHFIGMTAFRVSPLMVDGSLSNPEAMTALGFAVSLVGLVIVGTGFATGFIDNSARATAADALANMSNGLTMVSANGTVTLISERVFELFRLGSEDLKRGMPLSDYVAVIGRHVGWSDKRVAQVLANHLSWMRGGTITRVEHQFDDGTILGIACQPMAHGGSILTYEDITEARNGQKTIAHMAFHDALTGLKNRRMFARSIAECLADDRATMLMIDLDRFKSVNDRLGHAVGDELLKQVTTRLSALLEHDEQAFRLGGDELAVLLSGSSERAMALALDVTKAIGRPFQIESHAVTIGCSIGIAAAALGESVSTLQQKADLALYAAKNNGRNRFETYREGLLEERAARQQMEQDLAQAIAGNQLELWFQPLFGLPDRRLEGFEALVRWRHPTRGLILPGDFIPVAETSGTINAIGAFVIEAACRRAARWPDHISVSINVSALQLRSPALVSQLTQALSAHRIQPSRIEIEITETALVENSAQIALTLSALRTLGVRIAMDDFGTGYSSLAHLREFKVDRIKIDRSFIAAFGEDAGAAAIVRAVMSMAHELGIRTTAEGIEQEMQLDAMTTLGCGTAQGYLLGRPLEVGAADAIALAENKPHRRAM